MTKTEQLAILKKIISIQTVNQNEAELADYIASLFAPYVGNGVKIEKVNYAPGRDNLVVTIGNGGKVLGYSGHLDVVDPGDLAAWDTDPFNPVVKDGKLYGRGACDMKSGLAALVVALLEMLAKGQQPAGTIKLLATVGEETGNYGAGQLTKEGYADDLDGLVIAEPQDDLQAITYTCKGVIDYHVTSVGKAAHSSRPEMGINAIDNLLEFAHQAKAALAKFDHTDPVLGKLTHVISLINGGEQINNVPSAATLGGNIRTIPEYPNQVVYDELEKIITDLNQQPGVNLKIKYTFPEEPMGGNADAPLIKLAQKVAQQSLGITPQPIGSTGANDGQEFTQAKKDFTSIIIGPGGNVSHMPNEYVTLDAYYNAIHYYQDFAQAFFA
ncbi:ArgE/DapE family deacylase [uncultured Limosilactobacillus sp.]|uniref:ArgE/DapE family deacylase n=1 Tax=uncultured Limosilactobacillus sp. TaxID=2837629 RepID=UPI0026000D7D|nr:ArgE/DapE family deacylase [uncultured Limosilactobacillus sp.]